MTLSLGNDIIIFFVGALHLIVGFVLLLSFRSNKYVNIFLIFIILSGAIRSFYAGFRSDITDTYTGLDFSWIRFLLILTVPSAYLYLKTLIDPKLKISRNLFIHLLFPVLWSVLVVVQTSYGFISETNWVSVRRFFILGYVIFYLLRTAFMVKEFYSNPDEDLKKDKYFKNIRNWVFTFFVFTSLLNLRALIHFVFSLEDSGGLFENLSSVFKLVFVFFILFKILTSPEVLFGESKLKRMFDEDSNDLSESESFVENKILKINTNLYLKDKPIEDYFTGKKLECLLILLENNEFIGVNSLNHVFESEYKASSPTVKKRRETNLNEIRLLLSFRLNVPKDSVFIESREEIDKRIKLIKINPDLIWIKATTNLKA